MNVGRTVQKSEVLLLPGIVSYRLERGTIHLTIQSPFVSVTTTGLSHAQTEY